ncbi:MAG: hypothetical protein LC769_01945, partial [Chloroflexi bacterium]|nr:hypothetical protein [Chloroflexota bacterium]
CLETVPCAAVPALPDQRGPSALSPADAGPSASGQVAAVALLVRTAIVSSLITMPYDQGGLSGASVGHTTPADALIDGRGALPEGG